MTQPDDGNRPATRNDVLYAVLVLILVIVTCGTYDSCTRRLQINKLREDLQQR